MVLVRDVIERLSAVGELPAANHLVGVPGDLLDAWERDMGIGLPIDYRSFMEIAGATTNARLFRGSGFFWPAPLHIRGVAREFIDPDEYALIPDDALFILEHQGYIFVWLETADPASPAYTLQPVDVDRTNVERTAASFRDWLLLGLND